MPRRWGRSYGYSYGKILIEQKQLISASANIFELNPKHKIIDKINADVISNNKDYANEEVVRLMYDQACILEGEPVNDTGGFAKRLNDIMQKLSYKLNNQMQNRLESDCFYNVTDFG